VSADVGDTFRFVVGGIMNVKVGVFRRKLIFVAPGFLEEESENRDIFGGILYGRDSCSMVACTVE
jgi:hypothetical protein